MRKFIVRIELHGASRDHYVRLHDLMHASGFTNVIVSDAGAKFQLPPAEYIGVSNTTTTQMLSSAKNCARQIGLRFAVAVFEYSTAAWEGLPTAA